MVDSAISCLRLLACVCFATILLTNVYFLSPANTDLVGRTISQVTQVKKIKNEALAQPQELTGIIPPTRIQSKNFLSKKFDDPKCRRIFSTENVKKLHDQHFEKENKDKINIIEASRDKVIEIIQKRLKLNKAQYQRGSRNGSFLKKTSSKSQKSERIPYGFDADFYLNFSKDVPSAVNEDFSTINESRIQQVGGKYSWIPCSIREFDFEALKLCAASLETSRKSSLKIAFIGDSKAREAMIDLLEVFKEASWTKVFEEPVPLYNPMRPDADTYKGLFKKMRTRHAFTEFYFSQEQLREQLKAPITEHHVSHLTRLDNITGHEGKNRKTADKKKKDQLDKSYSSERAKAVISIDFFSSVYLREKRGLRELPLLIDRLEKYTQMREEELPIVIVISTLVWEIFASTVENLRGIDMAMDQFTKEKQRFTNILRTLYHKGSVILWLLNDPFKNNIVLSDGLPLFVPSHPYHNFLMEWFNTITMTFLKPLHEQGLVTIWDSAIPLCYRVYKDCQTMARHSDITENVVNSTHWRCYDVVHPHFQVTQVYAQMIVNFVCNGELKDVWSGDGLENCCVA